jgi:hypothetical protein
MAEGLVARHMYGFRNQALFLPPICSYYGTMIACRVGLDCLSAKRTECLGEEQG